MFPTYLCTRFSKHWHYWASCGWSSGICFCTFSSSDTDIDATSHHEVQEEAFKTWYVHACVGQWHCLVEMKVKLVHNSGDYVHGHPCILFLHASLRWHCLVEMKVKLAHNSGDYVHVHPYILFLYASLRSSLCKHGLQVREPSIGHTFN